MARGTDKHLSSSSRLHNDDMVLLLSVDWGLLCANRPSDNQVVVDALESLIMRLLWFPNKTSVCMMVSALCPLVLQKQAIEVTSVLPMEHEI